MNNILLWAATVAVLVQGGLVVLTLTQLVAALKAAVEKLIAVAQGSAAKDKLVLALQSQHSTDTLTINDLTAKLTAATAAEAADQATIDQQKADLDAAAADRTARDAKIAELQAQVPDPKDLADLQTTLQEAQDALAAEPTDQPPASP